MVLDSKLEFRGEQDGRSYAKGSLVHVLGRFDRSADQDGGIFVGDSLGVYEGDRRVLVVPIRTVYEGIETKAGTRLEEIGVKDQARYASEVLKDMM